MNIHVNPPLHKDMFQKGNLHMKDTNIIKTLDTGHQLLSRKVCYNVNIVTNSCILQGWSHKSFPISNITEQEELVADAE